MIILERYVLQISRNCICTSERNSLDASCDDNTTCNLSNSSNSSSENTSIIALFSSNLSEILPLLLSKVDVIRLSPVPCPSHKTEFSVTLLGSFDLIIDQRALCCFIKIHSTYKYNIFSISIVDGIEFSMSCTPSYKFKIRFLFQVQEQIETE